MRQMRSQKREEINSPSVVFEDESMLVINKPSGWIVNESQTTSKRPVVQTWIKENFTGSAISSYEYRNGIVHRIDKETSGILLIAKTVEAMERLQNQFRERTVTKQYHCLVHGELLDTGEWQEVNITVGRLPWNRERFGVLPGGRDSLTFYKPKGLYMDEQKNKYTYVVAKPKTGRTHQIRIHMKYLGHPVVADDFYAGRKRARADRKWCPRLFLHAAEIEFKHPVSEEKVCFESQLPDDLKGALENLKKID